MIVHKRFIKILLKRFVSDVNYHVAMACGTMFPARSTHHS